MSLKVIRQIMESPGCARGTAWSLLVAMADRASDDGKGIWESIPNLSKKCGISRATAFRAKDELLDAGLIIDTGRFHKNGGGRFTKIYELDLSRLAASQNGTDDLSHNETNVGTLSHKETPESQFATQTSPEPVLDVDVEEKRKGTGASAHSFAIRFWELQGNPERHRKAVPAWEARFGTLLAQEPELEPVLDWAFGQEHYWSAVLSQSSKDPMAFLLRKLADPVDKQGSIRQKHDEWRSRLGAAKRKSALRAARSPREAAAPPLEEPLWDLERMKKVQSVWHNLEGARAYFAAHRKEYEELHPEWLEEFKFRRIYDDPESIG